MKEKKGNVGCSNRNKINNHSNKMLTIAKNSTENKEKNENVG